MAVSIGAAVAITAFSACIAPWLDRQDNRNGDDQESRASPESTKTVAQLQPDSIKTLFLNGLRKFTSVCLPSVDMTESLQHFASKPFLGIDINIMSQSTQTDADSTFFTAVDETRTTDGSRTFRDSKKILQIVPSSSSSCTSPDTCLQHRRVSVPKIQKPLRAHPPRKSIDSVDINAAVSSLNKMDESTPIQRHSANQSKRDSSITETEVDNPSSTMETSECPKTFEVVVTVHNDASAISDSKENQKHRVSFAPDLNNNSSLDNNYRNNLTYVSSMGQSFHHSPHSSNIGASSSRNESQEHSSSLITRIRVVLSRYFHFGEKSRSRDATKLKGMGSRVQTESSGSNSTDDTIMHYPGKMSSIVRDLNSENERSKLSFSIAEVTSSTRIVDEAPGAFDPVRDRSESPIQHVIDPGRIRNLCGFEGNRDKSGKFQGILSGNFKNSRTTISDPGTEYPTFETKKGFFKRLKGFFQRDKSKKLSFPEESRFHETFNGKSHENYYGRSVLCTEL